MQHAPASRSLSATGGVLVGAALVVTLVAAPTVRVPGPADRLVALTSAGSGLTDSLFGDQPAAALSVALQPGTPGLDVADLDSSLNDIGLGSLVTNNDFFLQTDSTESIGEWFYQNTFLEPINLFGGVDESTLTSVLLTGLSPAVQDIHDMLNGIGGFGADLSQLLPDIAQGFDQFLYAAAELFLTA